MNRGLLYKAMLELWPATLMCGLLLFGVEAVLAYVLPTFQSELTEGLRQIQFIQKFVGAMLGVDASGQWDMVGFLAFTWVHPVVLALVWTHALLCCTRVPAGEIDRGTADVTFTLPVTRWGILRAETLAWLVAGALVLAAGLAGNRWGASFVTLEDERPPLGRIVLVVVNLYCLYLAVGGLSWLASAASNRRGPAMIVVFLVLLASFLLNFLAQFWSVARQLAFLGILDYYRPIYILRDGHVPWRDLGVLLGLAAGLWIAAGVVFARRDVCTV
jgi:hypothetical protein